MTTPRGGGRVQGGIAGDRGFFRLVDDADDIIIEMARPMMAEAAQAGYDVAFARAAFRTGRMRDSIDRGVRKVGKSLEAFLVVGEGAPYWQFVEYGTGMRGVDTNPEGIQSQGYTHGTVKGLPARPFMRPGFLAMTKRLGSR